MAEPRWWVKMGKDGEPQPCNDLAWATSIGYQKCDPPLPKGDLLEIEEPPALDPAASMPPADEGDNSGALRGAPPDVRGRRSRRHE